MKYFQLTLVFLFCLAQSYGQAGSRSYGGLDVAITKEKKPKKISTKVKITSAFPGGDSSFMRSVEKELDQTIPYKNKAKPGKYIVTVKFLLEKDGSILDFHCTNDPGFGMYEAVRVAILRNFRKGPRWPPGTAGSNVRTYRTSAIIFSPTSIKYKMDSIRVATPYPSYDLLPPEFRSSSLRNEYYAESDSMSSPTFYRGHVFMLTLRSNCTFIYETFYKPYSYARIEFFIGKYKISGDTISLNYEPLLPGKEDQIYMSPTMAVSWRLPEKPGYLLLSRESLVEPFEQRLKKTTSYAQIEGSQFELGISQCGR